MHSINLHLCVDNLQYENPLPYAVQYLVSLDMEHLSLLRSTAQRLNVTPVEDLPRIAGFLASSLAQCTTLGSEDEQKATDLSSPLHRLKTRLSSLLQGRTAAERLTASIVIKAYVEVVKPVDAGQWASWGRGLITCLSKPDTVEAKAVYLTTLARIFTLCTTSATLQREVVSPLLPVFLNASLAAVKPTTVQQTGKVISSPSQLLQTALHAWIELILQFSQTFRPFTSRLKQICLGLLDQPTCSTVLSNAAVKLLSLVQLCAPKATALNDWDQSVANVVLAAHQSLDVLFRGVVEDWASSSATLAQRVTKNDLSKSPKLAETDAVGLSGWTGLQDGTNRLLVLLRWLESTLGSPARAATIPFGAILDLLCRITQVTTPTIENHVKTIAEAGKDEKDELWANLPRLHVGAMMLITVMFEVFGKAMVPIASALGGLVLDVFEIEHWSVDVRDASYRAIAAVIQNDAWAVTQVHLATFHQLLGRACRDILDQGTLRQVPSILGSEPKNAHKTAESHARKHANNASGIHNQALGKAAKGLLQVTYEHASVALSHSVRAEMDRTAVFSNDQSLLLASTLRPPVRPGTTRTQPSLLPFLARRSATDFSAGFEALLRPRLPAMPAAYDMKMDQAEDEEDEPLPEGHAHLNGLHDGDKDGIEVSPQADRLSTVSSEPRMDLADFNGNLQATAKAIGAKRKLSNAGAGSSLPAKGVVTVDEAPSKRQRTLSPEYEVTKELSSNDLVKSEHPRNQSDIPQPNLKATFVAPDNITFHEPPKSTYQDITSIPDSDDDSDIPEIDPAPATDDEDD